MKKYISLIVCAVLVVTSFIMAGLNNLSIAGAGNGTAEKVTSIEELGYLIAGSSEMTKEEAEPTSYVGLKNGGYTFLADEEKEVKKYTSVSLSIATETELYSYSRYDDTRQEVTMSMKRDMNCYLTESACYYEIDALIQSKFSGSKTTSNSAVRIKSRLYVEKTKVLMYIDNLTTAIRATDSDGEKVETDDVNYEPVFNKWIDMTDYAGGYAAELMNSVSERNLKVMRVFGIYMLQNADEKMFTKSSSRYTLLESKGRGLIDYLLSIDKMSANDIADDASVDVNFAVDLSVPQIPKMDFFYSLSSASSGTIEGYNSSVNYNYNIKGAENMRCKIFEINNTVVKAPQGDFYDPKDFGELM